jgi:hypothetical protein
MTTAQHRSYTHRTCAQPDILVAGAARLPDRLAKPEKLATNVIARGDLGSAGAERRRAHPSSRPAGFLSMPCDACSAALLVPLRDVAEGMGEILCPACAAAGDASSADTTSIGAAASLGHPYIRSDAPATPDPRGSVTMR